MLFLSDKEFRQTIRYFESHVLTRAHETDSYSTDKIIYLTREVFNNLSFFSLINIDSIQSQALNDAFHALRFQ